MVGLTEQSETGFVLIETLWWDITLLVQTKHQNASQINNENKYGLIINTPRRLDLPWYL